MDFSRFRENARDFVTGMAMGRHEQTVRQQAMELNDLFLLLCYMEMFGLPNPAAIYMLEIYPFFLEQFHLWHRRLGLRHSPLGDLPCC